MTININININGCTWEIAELLRELNRKSEDDGDTDQEDAQQETTE